MTLPQQSDIDRVLSDRPGDAVYPRVKHHVEAINASEQELKEKLVALILNDMSYDLALANALDSVSEVLEYLAQERQIERPEFSGEILMRNFSRLSKLKLSLEYAKTVGIEGDALDAVLKAEIERLWQGENNANLLRQLLLNKSAGVVANAAPINYPPMYSQDKPEKKERKKRK